MDGTAPHICMEDKVTIALGMILGALLNLDWQSIGHTFLMAAIGGVGAWVGQQLIKNMWLWLKKQTFKSAKDMAKKNIAGGWKTSVIGIIIILAAIASVFVAGVDWMGATIGIALGTAFLFFPDDIVSKLKDFISKKTSE
jgi:hypothetical protein